MNCRHAQNLLSAHLDRELRPASEASLRIHLEGCPACRERLALLRRAGRLLDEPAPLPPAGLAGRIIRAAAAESSPPPARRPFAFPAWAPRLAWATAALLCILAGAFLGDQLAPSPAAVAPATIRQISGNEPLAPIYNESFRLLPSGSPSAEYLALIEEGGR
jgi:anti-sigma factor RsiW